MLNENIKRLRKARNLSQVELAFELGITKQCVSNWENGYIQPSIDMLVKIAKYFKVSTDYLLDLESSATIDVSGLSEIEATHIRLLIADMQNK